MKEMKEMKALQGVFMRTSTMAREQHYEELLSSWDDEVWKGLSDDWLGYMQEKKAPLFERKLSRDEFPEQNRQPQVDSPESTKDLR